MDRRLLAIAGRIQHWRSRSTSNPLEGLFSLLSSFYSQRKILNGSEPSAVFWLDRSGLCRHERWNLHAVPWKGSKTVCGRQCSSWLPEKAGRAFYQAMMQAFHHREPRETVVFLDTIGVTFANHFWFVPVDADEVMAIMRQHPFQPTTSL